MALCLLVAFVHFPPHSCFFFFFNDTATTEIYTLSLHDALPISGWLAEQPQVRRLYYPGLANHPGHDVARRQMRDFGGMISLSLKGGKEAALRLLTRTKLFSLAESLGGVESLIGHPATMTHASIPAEIRQARGIDDGLVRLSVGIEDAADLQEDLRQALN